MVKAGLVRLQLGLESGVQAILDAYHKQITLEEIRTVIKLCKEGEVPMVFCNVIVGGALETKDTVEETERFVSELLELGKGMLEVSTMIFIPYPNTSITIDPQKYGLTLVDGDSETSLGDYPVGETSTLKREDISRLNLWLRSKIDNKMMSLKDAVPLKQMLKHFQLHYLYGITSQWFSVFNNEQHKLLYFTRMATSSGLQHSSEIPPIDLPLYHPIRTVRLLDMDGEGLSILRISLTVLESDVIRYSSGKLTVTELTERLYHLHGVGMRESEFRENVVHILKVFEKRYWVSFSRF
jgi:hypothetical protein